MKGKLFGVLISLSVLSMVAAVAFAFTTEQAARGKDLFAKNCSACHGPDASGGVIPSGPNAGKKVPPLVGPNAFKTRENAAQVYEFASTKMPPGKPGVLKNEEYLDVVSFALQGNGIQPDGKPLTPESAAAIKLPGAKK